MPDREAQRWIRERERLHSFSTSSLHFHQSPAILSLNPHILSPALRIHLPHSSNAYATVALFLWGRLWGKKDWKSRWEGMMEMGGSRSAVCAHCTRQVEDKLSLSDSPYPPCATLFLRHHLHPPTAHPRSSLDEPCFLKHSRDWHLLRLR